MRDVLVSTSHLDGVPIPKFVILDLGFRGTCLLCSDGPSQAFISSVRVIHCVLMFCYKDEKDAANTELLPCVKSQHAFEFLKYLWKGGRVERNRNKMWIFD